MLLSDQPQEPHRLVLCKSFEDVVERMPRARTVAIDIPIGLLDEWKQGGRTCDREVRRLLGPRRSSVFPAPIRPALIAKSYEEVRQHHLSQQAYCICPKIRQVDDMMTPQLQQRVFESHPELAFASMSGRPMQHPKKSKQGRDERLAALQDYDGLSGVFRQVRESFEADCTKYLRKDVGRDDIVDAYVMAWVAMRIANGPARTVPKDPPVDRSGLRMEMWS